jgi:hypothetical protein
MKSEAAVRDDGRSARGRRWRAAGAIVILGLAAACGGGGSPETRILGTARHGERDFTYQCVAQRFFVGHSPATPEER